MYLSDLANMNMMDPDKAAFSKTEECLQHKYTDYQTV